MPSDISRTSDEQLYNGVVMQQGRVILDRDFNALRETIDRRTSDDALDFVGPCGTPDNGFQIGLLGLPGSPPIWSPPLGVASSNNSNFSISPGTMYVGGQRAVLPRFSPGQGLVEYSYCDQPDWVSPDPAPENPTQEFIYLNLQEQEVSAVEDPELKDTALGGPDTTQRIRLMKRVKRLTVTTDDCTTALNAAEMVWTQQGLTLDPHTMQLIPQATLQVTYAAPTTPVTACDPVTQSGYLGADNQLFRVQITDGGIPNSTPQLLWGTDNASFLYRATISQLSNSSSTALVLGQTPVDAFHIPQQGQVVEVLRSTMILGSDTGENSFGQSTTTVRAVAEATGIVCTLPTVYQTGTQTLTLGQVLPPEYLTDTNPLFVRIWQGKTPFTPDGITPKSLNTYDGNPTGVRVTIGGTTSTIGTYWMFAVRPSTPQVVYPERFLTRPQPADGPRQWVCPLAIIDWTTQNVTSPPVSPAASEPMIYDCRQRFDSLVSLSDRFTAEVIAQADGGGEIIVQNGSTLTTTELANGLTIGLNQDIDPTSVTPGACYLSMELPVNTASNVTIGYAPTVIAATVTAPAISTVTWNPSNSAKQYIVSQLPQVEADFSADWTVYPNATSAATWAYVGGVPQATGSATDATAFAGVLAVSTQLLGAAAQSVSASVTGPGPGQSLNGGGNASAGLLFNFNTSTTNFTTNNDFWVAAIVFASSNNLEVQVTHYMNGTGVLVASSPLVTSDPASTYNLSVGTVVTVGQTTLVATASDLSNPAVTTSVAIPTSLTTGLGVGLVTNFQGTTTFSQLAINSMDGATILLPPSQSILSRLTLKRDFLRLTNASAANNTPPPPRPDFSMWFWVQSGEARFNISRWDQCTYV